MASPSPVDRAASIRSRTLVAAAILSLCGAAFIAQRAVRSIARPCWGDIVPDAYVPSPNELARLPRGRWVGPRLNREAAAVGEFELHFVPIYHRNDETFEIGWANMRIVDPSSCSERAIPLDRGSPAGMIDPSIAVFHDDAHGVYIVHTTSTLLGVFRRRPAPGVKHSWTASVLLSLLLATLSGATLFGGVLRVARGRPGEALLAISLVLAVLGVIFGFAA
jgi:hypothetical protein